jgi:signal transduction histidine kinase
MVFKNINLFVVSITFILFLTTILYWIYIEEHSKNSYNYINKIGEMKLIDKEIDNLLFDRRNLKNSEIVVHKIKLLERKIEFFTDYINSETFFSSDKDLKSSLSSFIDRFHQKRDFANGILKEKVELYALIKFIAEQSYSTNLIEIEREIQKNLISYISIGGKYSDLVSLQNSVKNFTEKKKRSIFIQTVEVFIKDSIEIEQLYLDISTNTLFKELSYLEELLIRKFRDEDRFSNYMFYFLVLLSMVFLSSLVFLFIRDKKLQEELNYLNRSLHQKVEKEVQKNREKDKLIMQQAKLASLGEMIGNIAHQWRQPLNTLGIIIQDIENAYHFGDLDSEYIEKNSSDAMDQIHYMSSTIDDFRNFFRADGADEVFSVIKAINNSLAITKSSLENKNIRLIKDIRDDLKIKGSKNQYIQVVINIIKNGQDVLIDNRIESPYIKISLREESGKSILSIEDNGGGIPPEIMEKIFEPYFTTKHQSVGTGLGLYMSKTIIERNLKGQLRVENLKSGAKFSIIVPTA